MKQTDILNLAVLNELQSYGRSPQFLEQLIEIYEDHAKLSIAELNLALQRGDRANLRSVAHRLKGSSLNIGATAAANLLYIIERFPATEALDPSIVELLEELQGLLSVTTKALKLLK